VVVARPEVALVRGGGEVTVVRSLWLGFRRGSGQGRSMRGGGSLSGIQGRARKPWSVAGTSGEGCSPAAAAMAGGGRRAHARELRRWAIYSQGTHRGISLHG
jgi:hypothetical protein